MNINEKLINQIDNILPQTQCTRCGYLSCRDYAVALSNGEAEINQCPPGGDNGINKLSILLDKPYIPLNPKHGVIKPIQVAQIVEEDCIGCTLCIKACPVDAIIGSNKMLHTVIANDCTGCDLCLPACPVDCIIMVDRVNQHWSEDDKARAKQAFNQRKQRKIRDEAERLERLKKQSENLKSI